MKDIAFCITCMNRLSHIQKTLEKNICDNFLPGHVEFVLLDYNSEDGLEEWINSMQKYVDQGVLSYYKIKEPDHYKRSHSRNMAFRLSNAAIVCNLDADNFLGEGFAVYMIHQFQMESKMFYTSNYAKLDIVGRVCLSKKHFMEVRGYNEAFSGYGFEDIDLFDRLKKNGLIQAFFNDYKYYGAISHLNNERVSQEHHLNVEALYLSYLDPCHTSFLLFYRNSICESGTLENNQLRYYNFRYNLNDITEWSLDKRSRIILTGDIKKGTWIESDKAITITMNGSSSLYWKNNNKITDNMMKYYEIRDIELRSTFITMITDALNYKKGMEFRSSGDLVNPNGFGQGIVFDVFHDNQKIILE